MSEGFGVPEDCGVTDTNCVQCRLEYGHKGLHDFGDDDPDSDGAEAQQELFA